MISLATLDRWRTAPAETEHLEFKEAKQQFDTIKLLRYCAALANEGGGVLVLGVTNKPPRRIVGTGAFPSETSLNAIKARIVDKLNIRVEVTELQHPEGRVLVFEVPSRAVGRAVALDGAYLMRAGEDLTAMTPDMLKRIFSEDDQSWFSQAAKAGASSDEVIANALVHQDFQASGGSVMIEMYDDRIEISNPGIPPVPVERFIDEYRSRNERLADLMRRMRICEEKGSGIDKVVGAAEVYQLPAPDFRAGKMRTTAVLYAHRDFSDMGKSDRVRACYQHCCLQYVSNRKMSNRSLRKRFRLGASSSATVTASQVIGATKEKDLIRPDDAESSSTRYARYLPFWA